MELASIKIATTPTSPIMHLKFSQGKALFQDNYIIFANQTVLNLIPKAINFLLADEKRYQFQYVALHVIDSNGIIYRIEKNQQDVCIYRQEEIITIKPLKLLSQLFANSHKTETNPNNFQIEHHQIFPLGNKIFAKNRKFIASDEEVNVAFLSKSIQQILHECVANFACDNFRDFTQFDSFCTKILPLFNEYKILAQQYKDIFKEKLTEPLNCFETLENLKKQCSLLEQIETARAEVSALLPELSIKSKEISDLNDQITLLLKECSLVSEPDPKFSPDWSLSLQCLCYINVLEQMIPSLEKVIEYTNASNLMDNQGDIEKMASKVKERNSILDKLNHCFNRLNFLHIDEGADINPSIERNTPPEISWIQKTITQKIIKQSNDVRIKNIESENEHLRASFTATVKDLQEIKEIYQKSLEFKIDAPNRLLEFHEQSINKLGTLRVHWQKLADLYGFQEETTIHDFLTFIGKYNDIIIKKSKLESLKSDTTTQMLKADKLRFALENWYKATGSQNTVNPINIQVLLSEASNVLRYRAEKEKKFREIETNRLAIETNNSIKLNLEKRILSLKEACSKLSKSMDLTNFEIYDQRIELLLEKWYILRSLNTMKKNILSENLLPLFSPNHIGQFNTWNIALEMFPSEQDIFFQNNIERAPKGAINLILCGLKNPAQEFIAAGFGKAQISYENRKNESQETKDAKNPKTSKPTASLQHPKNTRKIETNTKDKAQNIVDILNGVRKTINSMS